tara:strand:- start:456 stop:1613 length:1158 start_codon:yes stop_codon:yes gene_type:complete
MAKSLFVFLHPQTLLTNAYSIVIDEQGNIIEPCNVRTLNELQNLNKHCHLIVIIPCSIVNTQIITLPTLKNAHLMLPNVLEETLVDPIDNIHFVLEQTPINDKTYFAYYVNKQFINVLLRTLEDASLTPSCITSDLLPKLTNLLLVGEAYYQLISSPNIGALSEKTYSALEPKSLNTLKTITFSNSNKSLCNSILSSNIITMNCEYQSYVAQQLIKTPGINLLQGAYQAKQKNNKIKQFFGLPLLILSLSFFIATNTLQYQRLEHTVNQLQADNFQHYKTIFPQASQMISPRFRVEQWLKQHASNQRSPFLSLLSTLSPLLSKQPNLHLLTLKAQSDQLTLTFQVDGFNDLNYMRDLLEREGINISQINALTVNGKINALWRLSL